MHYRTLGRTGYEVSEIGFGAWGIGKSMWVGAEDATSIKALHRGADLGLNFIDTALAYGDGHSERLVGEFVKQRSERIIVATKIPPKNRRWPAARATPLRDAFPADYIIERTETSLRNLGTDTLDLQQLHVWTDEWLKEPEWLEALEKLREQGKVRFFGVSINDHAPESALKLVASGTIDTVQVIYNIFDQSPEKELFGLCQRMNVGVLARVPLDEGGLTGRISPSSTFPPGDFRNSYFRGVRKGRVAERVGRLSPLLGPEASTVAELALRFCLHHPAVSTVIPGMRSIRNVEANCAASDGRALSLSTLSQLKNHQWRRNFYSSAVPSFLRPLYRFVKKRLRRLP
jgi:aryl-alcohol dehydrogenase-like predicted oxidoreductase